MKDHLIFKDGEDTVFSAKGDVIIRNKSASLVIQTAINMNAYIDRWYDLKKPWYRHLWDALTRKKDRGHIQHFAGGIYELNAPINIIESNTTFNGEGKNETTIKAG